MINAFYKAEGKSRKSFLFFQGFYAKKSYEFNFNTEDTEKKRVSQS